MKHQFEIRKRSDSKWWVWYFKESRWIGPFDLYPEDYAE